MWRARRRWDACPKFQSRTRVEKMFMQLRCMMNFGMSGRKSGIARLLVSNNTNWRMKAGGRSWVRVRSKVNLLLCTSEEVSNAILLGLCLTQLLGHAEQLLGFDATVVFSKFYKVRVRVRTAWHSQCAYDVFASVKMRLMILWVKMAALGTNFLYFWIKLIQHVPKVV